MDASAEEGEILDHNLHRAESVERKVLDESGPCLAYNLLVVFVTWQWKHFVVENPHYFKGHDR
jgi:hypothetical protein